MPPDVADVAYLRKMIVCSQFGWPPGGAELGDALRRFDALSAQLREAREALRELVACKDLKDRLAHKGVGRLMGDAFVTADEEYTRRKPLAWEAVRRALASTGDPTGSGAG